MRTRVTIGDFSRASHLSVKTLRHYHEVGLLEPSEVDPDNGYRYYSEDQIPLAQVIRRLRGLQMPVADVKSVLAAPDSDARNQLIVEHLDRLELELVQTRAAGGEAARATGGHRATAHVRGGGPSRARARARATIMPARCAPVLASTAS